MFIISHFYDRADLLAFVGSKQSQSGIIWGKKEPTCVIVTSGGRGGKSLGYSDKINSDGTIYYIGQGEKGDQNPDKFSNSLLVNGERSVLFFSTKDPNSKEIKERGNRRKQYKFEGIFEVASWEFYTPKEGKRRGDRLIQFLLIPANNVYNVESASSETPSNSSSIHQSLHKLRAKLLQGNNKPAKGTLTLQEYFRRSRDLVIYTKKRANGVCENCNETAPFVDSNNSPYLEVHHIYRLADDGPDEPQNVAALCPDCHREAHYGINRKDIKIHLEIVIRKKEQLLS